MWRGWARVLPSDRRTGRWRLYAVAGASAGGVIVLAKSNPLQSYLGESVFASACAGRVMAGCSGILRSSRAIFTFACNVIDYKYSLQGVQVGSEQYRRQLSATA